MALAVNCARCLGNDGTVDLRRLWNVSYRIVLCDECNTVVQGPDHIDVETNNLAFMSNDSHRNPDSKDSNR